MSFLSRYGKWRKRVVSAVLVASLAVSMPVISQLKEGKSLGTFQAYASSYSQQKQEAEDKRNEAEDKKIRHNRILTRLQEKLMILSLSNSK